MPRYTVESNPQKVYVHDQRGMCVARLCQLSAEYVTSLGENRFNAVLGSSFEKFQEECQRRFGVYIDDEHRPNWAYANAPVSPLRRALLASLNSAA